MNTFTGHTTAEDGKPVSRRLAEVTGNVRIDKTLFHIPSLDGIC
jgi:hypothetical protein